MPLAIMEQVGVNSIQQSSVKRGENIIAGFHRSSVQKHRQFDLATLNLPVMDELGTGRRRDDNRCGALPRSGKRDRGAGLVVVFYEADEPVLILEACGEMAAHAFGLFVR